MVDDLGTLVTTVVRAARAARTPEAVGDALAAVDPSALTGFLHAGLEPGAVEPLAVGVAASPGAASGRIVCSAEDALRAGDRGEPVILVRPATGPDDVEGMRVARGILTARGGVASHAAVVARGWGIPAVVGVADVEVDGDFITIGGTRLHSGDEITIDGSTGRVYAGTIAGGGTPAPAELEALLGWADAVADGHVEVRANCDTAHDAAHALRLGARGIGLCRTEHMFLAADRLAIMRRFVLAADHDRETAALRELEEVQTEDFAALLEVMDGLPVTVRLLDPPLHEFLPDLVDLTARDARGELSDVEREELAAVRRLHEVNPMIGTRGVRLGILRRGLYEMQVRALGNAAVRLLERGKHPRIEIMIPLVVDAEELRIARAWVGNVFDEIDHPELAADVVTVGAMIETPRAALAAAALAEHADFFSFGTNDLTQMTYALSRDDVEARLLPAYLAEGILAENPFVELDPVGVGALVRMACDGARGARSGIGLGVCGEHAGDPASIELLVGLGVDSLSCSPYRLPIARLAAARVLLASGRVRIDDLTFDFAPEHALVAPPAPAHDTTALEVDEGLVLHVLRIRGFVGPGGLLDSLGTHPADLLDAFVEAGLVRHIEARDMYGLLPAGRARQEQLLAEYSPESLRQRLAPDYDRFVALNTTVKQLCHDWQLRDGNPNDHADAAYDRACIERLVAVAADVRPVLESMAVALGRLARYGARLQGAVDAVVGGDTNRFTGVLCESFHDVWMEIHEDLVVLLGIDRAEEGSF